LSTCAHPEHSGKCSHSILASSLFAVVVLVFEVLAVVTKILRLHRTLRKVNNDDDDNVEEEVDVIEEDVILIVVVITSLSS
tara:strand:- start:2716 stop:2958 length:243 start_codon:yes stop_codon:yes gene_type:complete